jgi:hypothetical protein
MRAANPRDIIGRGAEVQALRGFLDQLTHGFASRVLVGDAGIGKTALLQSAVASAREYGYRVLSCRPAEAEAHLSFAGLADLLVDAVDNEAIDTLPEPQQRALNVVLLLQSPGKAPIDQRTVSAAVLSTVRTLAERGPLVVAIDDLQWLDAASASTLAFAVRRLQDQDRIGVLATIRLAIARDEPHDLLNELIARGAPRLAVGPLDMSTTGRIIAERLGSELPVNVLRKIRQVSGGNPLFALEVARAIIDQGAAGGQREEFPLPVDLRQTLRGRLSCRSPTARRALLLVSAFAHPTVASLATSRGDIRAGIEEAVAAGIVETEGDAVRFSHPLFASVVYSDASTKERRGVHAELAEIARDPEERARHLALSTDDPSEAPHDPQKRKPSGFSPPQLEHTPPRTRSLGGVRPLPSALARLCPTPRPGALRRCSDPTTNATASTVRSARRLRHCAFTFHPVGTKTVRGRTLGSAGRLSCPSARPKRRETHTQTKLRWRPRTDRGMERHRYKRHEDEPSRSGPDR